MTEIKNDPVPFRNRPLVERVGPDQVKKFVCSSASLGQALKQLVPNLEFPWSDEHLYPPDRLLQFRFLLFLLRSVVSTPGSFKTGVPVSSRFCVDVHQTHYDPRRNSGRRS